MAKDRREPKPAERKQAEPKAAKVEVVSVTDPTVVYKVHASTVGAWLTANPGFVQKVKK
jgi:hypothetical protein